MDTGETAAVVVACAAAAAVVAMVWAVVALTRTLREVRTTVDHLRAQAGVVLAELTTTVDGAEAELARVHELLATAEDVSGRVDSASRLAHVAVTGPLIKAMAVGAGTRGAARRLRQNRADR